MIREVCSIIQNTAQTHFGIMRSVSQNTGRSMEVLSSLLPRPNLFIKSARLGEEKKGDAMTENSKIEWTDHTFNPWVGCTKVSAGCKNCYAETLMTRKGRWADTWGAKGTRLRTSDDYWRKPFAWNRKAEIEGKRYKVFCGSLCDIFEYKDDQPEIDDWRGDLFGIIDQTPFLDWLLLTKRIEDANWWPSGHWLNVWLGVSVENQEQADKRIPELLKHPAAVRFLSCEPLLGPIDLQHPAGIDWVIVGGESGPKRRPIYPSWAKSLKDQCHAAGIPFFMKQIDKVKPIPAFLMVREFPVLEVPQ